MAMIKVFTVDGVKELQCFDTLSEIPYIDDLNSCEPDGELEEILDDLQD